MFRLSILIHGAETDRPQVNQLLMLLQDQLNQLEKEMGVSEIEAFFYLDDNKPQLKRKKRCLANTSGAYYAQIISPYQISPTYLKELWFALNENHGDEKKLAEKYKIYKRQPYQVNRNLPIYDTFVDIQDAESEDVTENE